MTAGVETPSFWLRPEDVPCGQLTLPLGRILMWIWGELNLPPCAASRHWQEPSLRPAAKSHIQKYFNITKLISQTCDCTVNKKVLTHIAKM